MMALRRLLMFALVFGLLAVAPGARAEPQSASVIFFYSDLAPYGRWTERPPYGTVWVPAEREPGWAPYTEGRWVWTSDYGWYWDSNEDFGWATYHYGRWVLTTDLGWIWIPDENWGPAWVDWRYSDGFVGWAPMPPEYRWRGGAFVSTNIDLAAPQYANMWIFVSDSDFAHGRAHAQVPEQRSRILLGASARVTNYALVDGRIVNRSIDPAQIAARAKVRIKPAPVSVASSIAEGLRIRAKGSVPLFKPRISARRETTLDPSIEVENSRVQDVPSYTKDSLDVRSSAAGSVSGDIDLSSKMPGMIAAPGAGGVGLRGGIGGGLRIGR
jgi:hypothetical protein